MGFEKVEEVEKVEKVAYRDLSLVRSAVSKSSTGGSLTVRRFKVTRGGHRLSNGCPSAMHLLFMSLPLPR